MAKKETFWKKEMSKGNEESCLRKSSLRGQLEKKEGIEEIGLSEDKGEEGVMVY